MNDSTTRSPLVTRYLGDVHRLLVGIDPAARGEILDGLREHLAVALPEAPNDDDVRGALAELGSPESVADAAYADRSRATSARVPAASRGWLPILAAALHCLDVLLLAFVLSTLITVSESGVTDSAGHYTVTQTHFNGAWSGATGGFLAAAPLWLVVVVLVSVCGVWPAREKLVLIGLVPAIAFAAGLLATTGYAVLGVDGVYVGGWTWLALSVVGGGGVLVVLTRRAVCRTALGVRPS